MDNGCLEKQRSPLVGENAIVMLGRNTTHIIVLDVLVVSSMRAEDGQVIKSRRRPTTKSRQPPSTRIDGYSVVEQSATVALHDGEGDGNGWNK